MAKVPMYTLAWSSARETYELYETRTREALRIVPDSSEWFAWLDQVSSFAFFGKSGHYTARKEARQRGSRYWYAYLATVERLTKKYLGKTSHLCLARLEHIAGILHTQSGAHTPPIVPLAIDENGEVDTPRVPCLPSGLIRSIHFCQPSYMCRVHAPTLCPANTSLSVSGRPRHARSR